MLGFLFLCATVVSGVKEVYFPETYAALLGLNFAVKGDLVYVLVPSDYRVHAYDFDGNLQFSFCEQGQGPGEITKARGLEVYKDEVIVFGDKELERFNRISGASMGSLTLKGMSLINPLTLVRTENGWIRLELACMPFEKSKPGIYRYDIHFKQKKPIRVWNEEECPAGIDSSGQTYVNKFPDSSKMAMVYTQDGARLALKQSKTNKILIYDVDSFELVRKYEVPSKNIPIAEDVANSMKGRPNARIPEFYPDILVMFAIEDTVYVNVPERGGQRTTEAYHVTKGLVNPQFGPKSITRILALRDGKAIINIYDPDEGIAGIAFVPIEQVDAYVDANPLKFSYFRMQ